MEEGDYYEETPLEVRNSAKKTRKKIAKNIDPKKTYKNLVMSEVQEEAGFFGDMELQIRKNKWKMMHFAISNKEGVLFWWDKPDKGPKGFRFLWDAKTQNDNKPENEGKVLKLISQTGSDLVLRCESIAQVATWKTEILKNSALTLGKLHEDAIEFWKYLETEQEKKMPFVTPAMFKEVFVRWIVEVKKLEKPTEKNLDTMLHFLSTIPNTGDLLEPGDFTQDQLKSYCTSFGYLTQSYREYDIVTQWYRGVLTPEEMTNMWDVPVHAYHFILRLETSAAASSTVVVTYTDKLLHVLHVPVIVHPYSSRFMLQGSGEVYETMQDLIESHTRLTFAICDNVDAFREEKAKLNKK